MYLTRSLKPIFIFHAVKGTVWIRLDYRQPWPIIRLPSRFGVDMRYTIAWTLGLDLYNTSRVLKTLRCRSRSPDPTERLGRRAWQAATCTLSTRANLSGTHKLRFLSNSVFETLTPPSSVWRVADKKGIDERRDGAP